MHFARSPHRSRTRAGHCLTSGMFSLLALCIPHYRPYQKEVKW